MSVDVSPTGRALLALETIQAVPGITGARLATRLGVSDRAARRYVEILREAGIPVESVSGRFGGYRIGRGARIPPLTFSSAEALGLVMAVLQGWHGSFESDHPAATALGKIFRVLPAPTAATVHAVRGVQAQNPSDAAAMPDPDLTAVIAQACEGSERIRIGYRTGRRMVLDPWAVVVRHGRWYLLGRLAGTESRRVLRLDRVTDVETTGEVGERPADLDAVREVEEHLVDGWTHDVEVHIDAPAERVGRCLTRALGRVEDAGPERCVLRGSTDDPHWYAAQLAAVPGPFVVARPPEIRDAVRALAERLARAAGEEIAPPPAG